MLFVQQATSVSVPTVYALFHDDVTGYNFIIQEYVPGHRLDTYWKTADDSCKEAVVTQLRRHFDELRSIPSPGYFGSIWRQPIIDQYMTGTVDGLDKGDVPPCETEEQWIETMLQNAEARYPSRSPSHFEFKRHIFLSVFRGHDPVFTHGDLHQPNILVRHDNTVVLIDWECADWAPSYVEYC